MNMPLAPLRLPPASYATFLFLALSATFTCASPDDCPSDLPLEGVVSIETCDKEKETCVSALQAVAEYIARVEDTPETCTVALHSSPWRLYDPEMRIITVRELGDRIRPALKSPVKSVALVASWTSVSPDGKTKSLAAQLSEYLGGFPVTGQDGFLWLSKDGSMRTTRQAFSIRSGPPPYEIAEGSDVMVSLAAGWHAEFEDMFSYVQDADGMLRVGVGCDIYFLCPNRALRAFEASAKMGNRIAEYNAALMRMELGGKENLAIAKSLLEHVASFGDEKAASVLRENKALLGTP